ncbi:hypothetical protein ACFY5K_38225 [Streptomyces griseofuscus]
MAPGVNVGLFLRRGAVPAHGSVLEQSLVVVAAVASLVLVVGAVDGGD